MLQISDYLSKGQKNAIPCAELERLTGLSAREIRKRVRAERIAGTVILSSQDEKPGYYLPDTTEEIERFCRSMEKRGRSAFMARKAAAAMLKGEQGNDGA